VLYLFLEFDSKNRQKARKYRINKGTGEMEIEKAVNTMSKILIVEDDEIIREELTQFLENAGYEVVVPICADDTINANTIYENNPNLILLDVNLPHQDGFTLCRQIRNTSQVPIIFITARDSAMDELKGLMLGGDDYITKPYNLPVLLARIGALLKRASQTDSTQSLSYKGVILNTVLATIEYKQTVRELSKTELKIIYYLLQNTEKIVPRIELIEFLWDNHIHIDDNTLSVHITRLRNKLGQIGISDFIHTKRGMGYKI